MKSTKTMTYKELENELFKNRCELRTASLERKRELITVRAAFRQSWSVAIAAASSAQKSALHGQVSPCYMAMQSQVQNRREMQYTAFD